LGCFASISKQRVLVFRFNQNRNKQTEKEETCKKSLKFKHKIAEKLQKIKNRATQCPL
jgi:hypothetical protein